MSRPVLSKYPHLRALLQKDRQANTEFNAVLNEIRTPDGSKIAELTLRVEELTTAVNAAKEKLEKSGKSTRKLRRLLELLGRVMETQTTFSPYREDISDKKRYTIEFTADQIRMALRLYWELVAENTENLFKTNKEQDDEEDT